MKFNQQKLKKINFKKNKNRKLLNYNKKKKRNNKNNKRKNNSIIN